MKHLKSFEVFEKWKEPMEIEETTLQKLKNVSKFGVLDDEILNTSFIANYNDLEELEKIKIYLEASNLFPHYELVDGNDLGFSDNSKHIIIVFEYEGDKLFTMDDNIFYYYGTKRNQIEYPVQLIDDTYYPREMKDKYKEFDDQILKNDRDFE